MNTKWGGTKGFRAREKVTYAVASGPDGAFDGVKRRSFHSAVIIRGNGTKDSDGRYYTYILKDSKSGRHVVAVQKEIWSRWK